jgi:hypothetical protein
MPGRQPEAKGSRNTYLIFYPVKESTATQNWRAAARPGPYGTRAEQNCRGRHHDGVARGPGTRIQ